MTHHSSPKLPSLLIYCSLPPKTLAHLYCQVRHFLLLHLYTYSQIQILVVPKTDCIGGSFGQICRCQTKRFTKRRNLGLSKFKAFADHKIIGTQKFKCALGRVETLWEKKKMLVTSIFFFSHNVFKCGPFLRC